MKHKTLSFRDQVFLACFLVTLVPLLLTSVVMVRLFTASLNRQSEQEANRQITEIRSRLQRFWMTVRKRAGNLQGTVPCPAI